MARKPDPVGKAIWNSAATSHSQLLRDAVPDVLKLLGKWATEVLRRPTRCEAYGSAVTGITDTSSDIDVALASDGGDELGTGVLQRLQEAIDQRVRPLRGSNSLKRQRHQF